MKTLLILTAALMVCGSAVAEISCSGDKTMDESHCSQAPMEHEHCSHFSIAHHSSMMNHGDKYLCICGETYCVTPDQSWRKNHGEFLR